MMKELQTSGEQSEGFGCKFRYMGEIGHILVVTFISKKHNAYKKSSAAKSLSSKKIRCKRRRANEDLSR
jgi:hypothetical protein